MQAALEGKDAEMEGVKDDANNFVRQKAMEMEKMRGELDKVKQELEQMKKANAMRAGVKGK